ncbi:MAG: DNA repair and recombination protein RadB [Nanopusillaceae archaeon]|jgi:DNA repair protein RadB
MGKISTGIYPIDKLLDGGLETDIITSFYGPSASGKTNIALISSYNVARLNKKVIFVDTEGGFSFERLKQISKEEFENVLKNILLYKPMNFLEQKKAIFLTYEKVKENSNDIGLIVIDSVSMLYRLEKGDEDVNEVNIELAKQLQILSEISRKYNISVLVTNHVYSLLEEKDKIGIVGGDLIKYWSKCLVELKVYDNGIREAILRKHRYLPEGVSVKFKIVNDGIIEYKDL